MQNNQKKKMDTMVSEDIFRELMEFLKSEKEVTKELLHRQETSCDKSTAQISYVTGQTFTILKKRVLPKHSKMEEKGIGRIKPLCMVCKVTKNSQDAMHWTTDCEV